MVDSPEFEDLTLPGGMLVYTAKMSLGAAGIRVVSPAQLLHRSKLSPVQFAEARDELIASRASDIPALIAIG